MEQKKIFLSAQLFINLWIVLFCLSIIMTAFNKTNLMGRFLEMLPMCSA